MLAVSNTSPISNLTYIGRLSLLPSRFSEIWIPPAVSRELKAHPDVAGALEIEQAIRDGWIRVQSPSRSHLIHLMSRRLDTGEAEAIALAIERKTDVILLDEAEGRDFGVQLGLCVMGVLGILLAAKRTGEIAAIRPEIQLLRHKANFFIARRLEAEIIAAAGE